tara:strand:- start:79 stop:810 length:732 start_codon:yes stop_codon:yes gene_type:complete
MKLIKLYFFLILFFPLLTKGQERDSIPLALEDYVLIKTGDTLTIALEEFSVLPKLHFKSSIDARYYYWFRRKVFKAYPFAKVASQRLDSLNARLERINSRGSRKRYVKRAQKYLEGEFTEKLKKMTRTEGRILIKLIHRQTGKTTFDNIKNVKSGWKAFWYNTTANLFKLSLKSEYHPEFINEDYLIEDILQRAFIDEKLDLQKTKLAFDFPKIASSNKGKVDVEEYKKMFVKNKKKRFKNKN